MNVELINEKKQQIIKQYGDWTAHNVHLTGDVYTIGNFVRGDEYPLRRIVQVVSDVTREPLENLRVLDLACLEGQYAIELARHGARAVGIEAREANLEKARFVKDVLSLDNLELAQDDVRNLSAEKYGLFDVVLCLGILYHLDVPDVIKFIHSMAEVCTRCLVIDTHISFRDEVSFNYEGKTYWGSNFTEHVAGSTDEEKEERLWASIDNAKSFWFTRPSLLNLLSHAGFTSVYECHNPPEQAKMKDRVTLVAIKGQQHKLISAPLVADAPIEDWPEQKTEPVASPSALRKLASTVLPTPVKKAVKKVLR